jgi:4-hydroxy-tetrahydrodipicolinate reductase
MNILILGKGKTGALVAEVAGERGHNATAVSSADNLGGAALTREKLAEIDVVIDFTTPSAVLENISAVARAGKRMVVGTTGWYGEIDYVRKLVEEHNTGLVYGSNFSIGVNIFFEIVRSAAAALNFGYVTRVLERHHAHKKDAPSGTAATIQQIINEVGHSKPEITSIREGETVGTHVMFLDSENDSMMLVHDAKSRRGFAEGAVRAAEWIHGKTGFYEFKDIFREM